ncbi:MAG: phosphopentomutase, partial [Clostridiales bacterium]
GLAIIEELGEEQQKTGKIIVYTSADSVLQIAAHEEVVSLDELYKICTIARELLTGIHGVGRVIARPFLGEAGAYYRTENRKDFSLMPPAGGLLQRAREKSLAVFSVGKIYDIFAGKDISQSIAAHNNRESIEGMKKALSQCQEGLIFVNLVDFDMLYGHRNDSSGYAQALEAVDKSLGEILPLLKDDDLLFITSDHGNDPTTQSTDHNREYALLLAYGKKIKAVDLGVRKSFADLGATAAEYLDLENLSAGESFLQMIIDNN